MRVCIVYDCLFPHTVGGAERWYRGLAERLAAEGHDVTYLTRPQWPAGERPDASGFRVVAVGPRIPLYTDDGRRRMDQALLFGLGVGRHLLAHGDRYDAVHTCAFPYFSVLAAAAARRRHRYELVVDWFEVWTAGYWREYLGPALGPVGRAVQSACLRVDQRAFCFSRLHAERMRADGLRGEPRILRGLHAGAPDPAAPQPAAAPPRVVFAGRHIPEKRVPAIPPAIARARERLPELRALVLGDGPDQAAVRAAIDADELAGVVELPGFVAAEAVDGALATALCLLLPSRREGYGLVVVEAAAHGTPSIVVADPDNAATELIEDGVNGFVAPSASPEDLAGAILRVHAAGPALRAGTAAWSAERRGSLSLEGSLAAVAQSYASARS